MIGVVSGLLFITFLLIAHAHPHPPGREPPVPRYKSSTFTPLLLDFNLNEVRLNPGSAAYDGQQLNKAYLHLLDADRLLYNFMVNAKLNTTAQPLGGWEAPDSEVRGHFAAMYLTASAKAYNSYGDLQQKQKADYIVSQLAKCQVALGGGYLSAFPTSFFDRLEALEDVWAPYYMIHKIMQGLWDMNTLAGNQQAYPIILNMATYFVARIRNVVATYSIYRWQQMLQNEYGGLNEFMYILYNRTGNPDHLYMAEMFDMGSFLGPLALGQDPLTTQHANQHIPIVLGAARRYQVLNDELSRYVTETFWGYVYNNRTYATGGTSGGNGSVDATNEHWGDQGRLALTLTDNNQEFCVTYNMLKLVNYLIQWTADVKYMDHYERAFFNGILGTQNPLGGPGVMLYNYPLANGFTKAGSFHGWGDAMNTFWCCYATAIEQWAKMGEAIYFKSFDDTQLYVNLFVPSTLTWTSKNITVAQITNFPNEPHTALVIRTPGGQPTKFTINVHSPYWVVGGGGVVSINNQKQSISVVPSSFIQISRIWNNGDLLNITLPMNLHLHYMNDDPTVAAVMFGPLVLAGLSNVQHTLPLLNAANINQVIKPVPGKINTFVASVNGGHDTMELVPINTIITETYGVYWKLTSSTLNLMENTPKVSMHVNK